MSIADTIKLWRNAIRSIDDKGKLTRQNARKVLDAVKSEWIKRRAEPVSTEAAFSFPTTSITMGAGNLDNSDWQPCGVLSLMGYRVGETDGEPKTFRRKILDEIFNGPLPPAFPLSYFVEWGEPQTILRLQKLAETIAALTRNAKRRQTDALDAAIRDWESDLEYLFQTYYAGKHYFVWPVTTTI